MRYLPAASRPRTGSVRRAHQLVLERVAEPRAQRVHVVQRPTAVINIAVNAPNDRTEVVARESIKACNVAAALHGCGVRAALTLVPWLTGPQSGALSRLVIGAIAQAVRTSRAARLRAAIKANSEVLSLLDDSAEKETLRETVRVQARRLSDLERRAATRTYDWASLIVGVGFGVPLCWGGVVVFRLGGVVWSVLGVLIMLVGLAFIGAGAAGAVKSDEAKKSKS